MKRIGNKVRVFSGTAALGLVASAAGIAAATPAQAWPWDTHVRVWFNVNACAGAPGQWGWYSDDQGESGWVQWNAGYQGYFDLYKVTTSGTVTSIKWGTPGRTCGTRFFNITRPVYGTTDALGWIG
jgi:hypothetical protein